MATILIVDDLASNRKYLATLLRSEGHQLLEAADGAQGLAVVLDAHPDLVITDVLMPVMDGYELVRRLRLDASTSRIPVLFYTAPYGEREARAQALASGVPYVLTKPALPETVLAIVGRVLAGDATPDGPAGTPLPGAAASGEQLRLLTARLTETAGDLRAANARLRALINIGLELTSERDPDRQLQQVCDSACDLIGASSATLCILDRPEGTVVKHLVTSGSDASDWMRIGDEVSGLLATVATERRAFRGEHPGGDTTVLSLPPRHPAAAFFLAVPITSAAHCYGWILLVREEEGAFAEDEEDLVMALAWQVGRSYALEWESHERRLAEIALRVERDRSQRYLDTAEVILLALDLTGRIALVNRYACSVLGWTADELLGCDWAETCLPRESREAFRKGFARLIDGGTLVAEHAVLTRSGEERLFAWRNTLLRDDDGKVIAMFSSGTDITERARAIEALRAAEERMRFALQSANVGIWDRDYTTGALQWSETIEAHYGLSPGTFGGTFEAFLERVHPDDRAAVRTAMERAESSREDFSVEHRALWTDGTVRWLAGAGRVHGGENGEPVRGLGISLDITERRSLETQYQQAQKMEAIGRLAGGVAHDFNNLLTVILGYCELLLADLDDADPGQQDIAEIQKAGLSAARLTRQLLAFSRREIIEPALLDVNLVVAGMGAILGRLISEDVHVVLALRPGLALVTADRGQVEQIVMNLALNARDAMPEGGRLTIETANATLDEGDPATHRDAAPGRYVVLTVTDTGTGMTPEVQARLFEPFYTTKAPGKGTGLGLATVHGIARQNGGTVTFSSAVGRGTSIRVYLPRSEALETAGIPSPVAPRLAAGTQTVLVVEDADVLRELTRRLLERQGYTVLVAAGAEEALAVFERHPGIDLLLTDVVMPGTSGPELTGRLRERCPSLKVVYMSGYTEDTIVHHGVLNPGIAFLHKPFTAESLSRKLQEVLAQAAPV